MKAVWRKTKRKGVPCAISPDGQVYYGTAAEVRDAALMPRRRNMLAQSIEFARHFAALSDYTPEERREYVREKRRDAIRAGCCDTHCAASVAMSPALYLQLAAGARLVMGDGETVVEDYFAQLFRNELEALLDIAESETGRREIPLTRHERAALERIAREQGAGASGF